MEGLVGQLGLTIHNTALTQTFVGPRGSSFVGLTLTITSMEGKLQSWKVHDKVSTSDHKIIIFNIVYQNSNQPNTSKIVLA